MKFIIILLYFLTSIINPSQWNFDFEKAKITAENEGKHVLIYFSGSDWCRPCIQLKGEVMENPEFIKFSKEKFVMVLADFPKRKKNRLDENQVKHNEALAEKYNLQGYFPLIVITDAKGKVVGTTGFERIGVEEYIEKFKGMISK